MAQINPGLSLSLDEKWGSRHFWRDLGYAIGALSAGLIADAFGFSWAIASIAGLTFLSGVVVAVLMRSPKIVADGSMAHSPDRSNAADGEEFDNAIAAESSRMT